MAGAQSFVSARAGLLLEAAGAAFRRQVAREWRGSPLHLSGLDRPRAEGWAAGPNDARPADPIMAGAIIGGVFALAGETLAATAGSEPWTRASPSQRFALALHRFDWLPSLMSVGEAGQREGLRLTLAWERVFGRWNRFSWAAPALERRVFNLACAGRAMTASASQAERLRLSQGLARQARHLLQLAKAPPRAAEQLAAAAVAGAALAGAAGQGLLKESLTRLGPALDEAVRPDGGHASRSAQVGLELLFDLLALEDGLSQRGAAPPDAVSRAIDRLTAALAVLTLSDGRLVALQGGETSSRDRVAAARAHGPGADVELTIPADEAPRAGYQRLNAPGLQVVVDAAAPAEAAWSLGACGQPVALEVVCGRDRLITSSGWSPEAAAPQALRMAAAASTVTIGLGHLGAPLAGFAGRALGPRLVGGVKAVTCSRRENEAGVWVDLAHDGWVRQAGLIHERRLFLDKTAHELRGEDRFVPTGPPRPASLPIAIYFHLHPEVTAVLARDQRSVLLRGRSEIGWWLRNDAGEVSIEASTHLDQGRPRRAEAVVLRARLRADRGGRVRWKLALAEPAPEQTAQAQPAAD
ncbi:MAG TPA: heparinase II/III family protein [Caulobacteraceae bacterium]|jgi:uncharacterized heparinase superfamily protein|nr:heparinase II/III family protein [Caulobacteraceae bacterium]